MLPLQYLRQPRDRLAEPEKWPYSFENLCETIGVDAGSLRQPLARRQVSSA